MPNILNDKFTPGPLPEVCAPRQHLLDLLKKAADKRLVCICAPAGSGKTVTALLWGVASSRLPVWINLDVLDNSAAVFYRMFCTGILCAQPSNSRMTAILQADGFDASPVEHTINFLSELVEDGREYVLTLDDFQAITNREILKSLPLILRRLPHSFVTLILSRTEPEAGFAEMIEEKRAAIIDAKELEFGEEEIEAYFKSLGRKRYVNDAHAAFSFTGGWAIGVNILAQSHAPMPEGYGGHALESYIKKHIWDEWEENLREFMIASAAIDEMPVALCENITGFSDVEKLLETLRAKNVFVERLSLGVYRYHHLFLDFLRNRPEYKSADNKSRLIAATNYYIGEAQYEKARAYAFASGDVTALLDTMYASTKNRGILIDDHLDSLRHIFLSRPPKEVEALCEKLPVLYCDWALAAFLIGRNSIFEQCMDRLYGQISEILEKYPQFDELLLAMFAVDYRMVFSKQVEQAKSIVPVNFTGDTLRGVTFSIHMPFLHRSCRDFYELVDISLHKEVKKAFGGLLKSHYELAMKSATSGLFLEQNRFSEALALAKAGYDMSNENTVKEIRFAANMHLAAVYFATGQNVEMSKILLETKRFVNAEATFLRHNFLAFTARIKLFSGDAVAAKEWLNNYFVVGNNELRFHKVYQYFTTVRAYSVLGEFERAKDLAKRLRKFGRNYRRPQDAAEAGTLLCAIMWASGEKEEAVESLTKALSIMQPLGFVRIISDEGAAILPAIKKILGKVTQADYQGVLDPVYVNNVYLSAYTISRKRGGIFSRLAPSQVKLSKQQKKIVSLMAQGYRREGIIEITGLSLGTVKSHITQLYSKLEVGNSADAVIKAREMGLIE